MKAALSKTPAAKRDGELEKHAKSHMRSIQKHPEKIKAFFTRSLSDTPAEPQGLKRGNNMKNDGIRKLLPFEKELLTMSLEYGIII
ncbi:MAG: hypothetical protein L6W00_18305 [Lentisphaeria bacterium]|nr:MAG: hypothetical protein L6W00_18305 [Lentisphaeria bacterium]